MGSKLTAPVISHRKRSAGDDPLVMLTAYDAPSARMADEAGADLILVGDSVAMVVLGHDDTMSVTIDEMAHHTAAVARTRPKALVVADMPWMSYHVTAADTVTNAAQLVRAGAQAVKLEGGSERVPMIEAIISAQVPVMGHLGRWSCPPSASAPAAAATAKCWCSTTFWAWRPGWCPGSCAATPPCTPMAWTP